MYFSSKKIEFVFWGLVPIARGVFRTRQEDTAPLFANVLVAVVFFPSRDSIHLSWLTLWFWKGVLTETRRFVTNSVSRRCVLIRYSNVCAIIKLSVCIICNHLCHPTHNTHHTFF